MASSLLRNAPADAGRGGVRAITGGSAWRARVLVVLAWWVTTAAIAGPDEPEAVLKAGTTRDVMESVMGSVLPPGIEPAALPEPESAGAQLLQRFCVQCHKLPSPGLHSAAEWPAIVDRMQERVQRITAADRELVHAKPLNTAELETLLSYLRQYGFKTLDVARYPDLDTDIGKAYQALCSQCHALPDPSLHDAEHWRTVVLRMRSNMELLGMPDPGDEAIARAMSFLQVHAAE
jgi:cytochrome c5